MSEAPQGPGWWQASDGRWYPPHTHPSHQQPHQQPYPQSHQQPYPQPHQQPHQQPMKFGPPPAVPLPAPVRSGVPKGLIVAGVVVLVVVVLGFAAMSFVGSLMGDRLENAVGGECTLVAKDEVDAAMGGEFDLIQLGGLTKIATPALDSRVLADGTTCWATETAAAEDATRLVRIARFEGADAQARFQQERTLAQGVKQDQGGGLTVESQPYFNKDVTFGDEAFCTTTDFIGSSGVLVRRGNTLIYVSLTSGGIPQLDPSVGTDPNGPIKFADDDAHCDLAQKIAAKVG